MKSSGQPSLPDYSSENKACMCIKVIKSVNVGYGVYFPGCHYSRFSPFRAQVSSKRSLKASDIGKPVEKATVFGAVDSLNVFFSSFAYSKGTSLCQYASFEPSTINIGSGFRPVDVR